MNEFAIGVDIGGTRTKLGLVNLCTGAIQHVIVAPTERDSEALFLQHIVNAVRDFRNLLPAAAVLKGIGLGVPSYVDGAGVVDNTYGFLGFMENYPLKSNLEKLVELTCLIDNDARVVALGEAFFGAGKQYQRVLVLTLGTGLGVGFIVDRLFPDSLPLAHMSGHMSIQSEGALCYCGKRGCLESLVSSAAITDERIVAEITKENPVNQITMEKVFALANSGVAPAKKVVDNLVVALHKGIHNYINLLAPDIIILGGGISKGLAGLEKQIINGDYLLPFTSYKVSLVISDLQEQAGILGAASLFKLKEKHL